MDARIDVRNAQTLQDSHYVDGKVVQSSSAQLTWQDENPARYCRSKRVSNPNGEADVPEVLNDSVKGLPMNITEQVRLVGFLVE